MSSHISVKGIIIALAILPLMSLGRMIESALPEDFPGGISSLSRVSDDEYLAVSDRGELLNLKIKIDSKTAALKECEITSRFKVKTRYRDLEAVCRAKDGRIFVTDDCGKSAYEIDANGKKVKELEPLRAEFKSAKYNLGPEAIEYGAFGTKDCIWTMTELPRTNDVKSLKLFKYSLTEDKIVASYDYDYDYAVVDFLNDPKDNSLLVLERNIGVSPKIAFWSGLNYISIKIFRVRLNDDGTLEKTLLFKKNTGSVNYEGMEWTTDSLDGKRRIILISDKDITNKPIRIEWPGRLAVIELEI